MVSSSITTPVTPPLLSPTEKNTKVSFINDITQKLPFLRALRILKPVAGMVQYLLQVKLVTGIVYTLGTYCDNNTCGMYNSQQMTIRDRRIPYLYTVGLKIT